MKDDTGNAASVENRRLAAIMFTDIIGFSRQMGTDEARTMRLLALHNQVIRQAATDCRASTDEKGNCNGLSWNAEASRTEEPGAGKPHAGICAGAAG
jgi:hypothetical protein